MYSIIPYVSKKFIKHYHICFLKMKLEIMDEAQRDCRAEIQVARSTFSVLLRKEKVLTSALGHRSLQLNDRTLVGCPESSWAAPDTAPLCLCRGTRWRGVPGPRSPRSPACHPLQGHRVRKRNSKPPCFASSLRNNQFHRDTNTAHCETSIMKRCPSGIHKRPFFPKHFAALKNSFHSILSWRNVFLSRKKN